MLTIQKVKPYFIGAFGMAVMAMIISPDVRSAAAALVSVTNTFTNPVPTRAADNPALHGFAMHFAPIPFQPSTFVVPAGKYLVLNDITGFLDGTTTTAYSIEIAVQTNGVVTEKLIPFDNFASGPFRFLRDQHILLVADPGSKVFVIVDDLDQHDPAEFYVDLRGYYVSAN